MSEGDSLRSEGPLSLFLQTKINTVKAGTSFNTDSPLYLYCLSEPRIKVLGGRHPPKTVCVDQSKRPGNATPTPTLECSAYNGYILNVAYVSLRFLSFVSFTFYSDRHTDST